MAEQHLILIVRSDRLTAWVAAPVSHHNGSMKKVSVLFEDPGDSETDEDPLNNAVDKLIRQMDISAGLNAVILVSPWFCFFRFTELPFKSKSKIRQVLPMELAGTFPMENEAFLTRFQILGQDTNDKNQAVFSVSVKEAQVQTLAGCFKKSGITPVVIAPENLVLSRLFLTSRKDIKDVIFLSPGKDKTVTATVFRDRQPVLVRSLQTPRHPDPALQRELDRMILGLSHKPGIKTGFHIILAEPETPVSDNDAVMQVAGSSPGSRAELLLEDSALSDNPCVLGCEAVPAEDLLKVLSPKREIKGLFNFWEAGSGNGSFVKSNRKNLVITGVLISMVFIFFMMSVYMRINDLERKIIERKQVAERIFMETFPDKKLMNLDPLLAMQAQVKVTDRKKGTISNGETNRDKDPPGVVDILFELSQKIPPSLDVELSRLMFDRERLMLAGSTQNFNTVDQVKGYVEKSGIFKSVEISSAASTKDGKRVAFKFMVKI